MKVGNYFMTHTHTHLNQQLDWVTAFKKQRYGDKQQTPNRTWKILRKIIIVHEDVKPHFIKKLYGTTKISKYRKHVSQKY